MAGDRVGGDIQKRFIKAKRIAHAHSHSHAHLLSSGIQPEGGGIGRCTIVELWYGVVAGHCIVLGIEIGRARIRYGLPSCVCVSIVVTNNHGG